MASENTQNRASWPVAFGELPRKGSRAMPQTLDFSLENPININLSDEVRNSKIEFVQAIFVDNSKNPNSINCSCKTTGQNVNIPAGWQGFIPVLASSDQPKFTFSTVGTLTVPVFYLSFPCPLALWPTGSGSTGYDYTKTPAGVLVNLLSTIPVNAGRCLVDVQNQSANTIQVVLDDGAGNNQSIILLGPGFQANSQGGEWTSATFKGRLRVYSTSAADQVMVREE